MFAWILEPWPWYVTGPLIGLTVPLMLWLTGRSLGISGSLRTVGAMCTPNSRLPYLNRNKYDWREKFWKVVFVAGVVIGGFVGNYLLSSQPVTFLPTEFASTGGMMILFAGGILIGFGTRYANGCTSGHTIMGLSQLNWVSLVATVFFFVGGLISTWLILPLLGL